ncbi:hypothetical protein CWC22_014775 [Pseudoalteromonas rubra]|uniref:Uncharacterized protein n=1 Tax=Pseudoalteromonas rubra TaxID=43658 RepID=A0A5S3UUS6_9GAMM|nr:hypothetical protein [Pseudoalteromonas rubra]QPB84185.1 hypothetical protein CWC22_014775 [Pseudoalteromonas rubra]
MVSKAYREGQNARSYSDNPYERYSPDYNDFERGYTQKLKRTPDYAFRNESGPIGDRTWYELKGSRVVEETPRPKLRTYADARKK